MCSLSYLRIVCCVSGWHLDVSLSAGFACVFLLKVKEDRVFEAILILHLHLFYQP